MRIFTAALATETNTFSPICVDRKAFEESFYAGPGQHPETATLCTAPVPVGRRLMADKGWTLIEGTATWADPAGLVNRQTYEGLRDEILDQLRAAMPVNAVVLGLHGAMVADGYVDPEGDFLTRIREIVGPDILVCAELDPHSHLTAKRVAAADFFVAFKEFPHTDFVDRAHDLWAIAIDTLEGRVKPVMSTFDCRMIDVFPTSREPMRSFVDKLMRIEREDADMLSLSVIHGFMAGDVPEMGTKTIVVTNGKKDKGERIARHLGLELFSNRGKHMMPWTDEKEAVASAIAASKGPVVIADMWDNPGGGTAGDATVVLAELFAQGATDAAIGTIWDPVAVQICMAAGEGAEIPLRFGAKSAPGTGNPIDGRVRIIRLVRNAEMKFGESIAPFGDSAHIRLNGIDIILNSIRAQSYDPSLFSAMGIDPTSKKILVIKSTNHFYAAFSKIASDIIYCSAGTPYPNNPATTPYQHAPCDIWPMVDNPHGDEAH
ncbi:M81 family metallopeptidase [Agrobacterium rubi]|uniref:M81 family metallopeptidase n=1 Tax=Agrobacterium rubi TaxID=28099 RepID=UPI001571627C|nr:M81 family metallopeptidase [Agrobacterium rubi]MCL6652655.1 microcystin LR degradation protein MlrC-like protein [Agrobacterium rubi]NTF09753.1 M81 family metallopeptidase [Agrobacterium rubi]NTF22070.1 M81 family metallopeptidase [Agrobacterium rubi]NTF28927.1 M81 family metallopeptidase [Agrobacterium rubi]